MCTCAQSNIVDAPKKAEKVRDPVPDEQLAKLRETLTKSHAAQAKYASFTQVSGVLCAMQRCEVGLQGGRIRPSTRPTPMWVGSGAIA